MSDASVVIHIPISSTMSSLRSGSLPHNITGGCSVTDHLGGSPPIDNGPDGKSWKQSQV